MRLFRSEEHVGRIYERPGSVFPAARLWLLAQRWYGDRLDSDWRPRTRVENQRILTEVGLTGSFWRLG